MSLITREENVRFYDLYHKQINPYLIYQSNNSYILPLSLINNLTWFSEECLSQAIIEKLLVDFNFDGSLITKLKTNDTMVNDTLSAGQLQRLEVIQTSSCDADLYFFDEPTSNLDEANKIITINKIIELNRKRQTISVIVTHDSEVFKEIGNFNVLHVKQLLELRLYEA